MLRRISTALKCLAIHTPEDRERVKSQLEILGALAALVSACAAGVMFLGHHIPWPSFLSMSAEPRPDLTGRWVLQDTVTSSANTSVTGNTIEFNLDLHQDSKIVFGSGRKIRYRGATVPDVECSSLYVQGIFEGREANLTATEQRGAKRFETNLVLHLDFADSLTGVFRSNAASTSGASRLSRAPGIVDISCPTIPPTGTTFQFSTSPNSTNVAGQGNVVYLRGNP